MARKPTGNGKIDKSHLEVFGFTETNPGLKWVSDKENEQDAAIWLELERAEILGAEAVYFRYFPEEQKQGPKAQVYIYSLENESEIFELRRKLWNASPVPLIYVFLPDKVEIFDTYSADFLEDKNSKPIEEILFTLSEVEKAKAENYNSGLIDSGLFWDMPEGRNISTATSSYQSLLQELKGWKAKALSGVTDEDQIRVVKRVLLSIILIRYLEDRKDANGLAALNKKEVYGQWIKDVDAPELEHIFQAGAEKVNLLFKYLSGPDKFNGAIFLLKEEEYEAFSKLDLRPFIKFLEGKEDPNSTQLRLPFWEKYNFGYLPIELISHIYEDFLATEGKDGKKDTGVVYTPPSLVQFLIDQMMPIGKPNLHLKVLDPACGSGIFLVGAFKRMIQWWRIENKYIQPGKEHIPVLKQLLLNNIYGADINQEAVLISYFSLSLALLDAFSPKDVWGNVQFPNLRETNLFGDFFDSDSIPTDFDFIIGNPPFKSKLKEAESKADKMLTERARLKKLVRPKLPDNQLALLFLEQSFQHLKVGGKTCFLLPSGPVLYNLKVSDYRRFLMEQTDFETIYDFTSLRTSLFKRSKGGDNKQPPVVALVVKNQTPSESSYVNHFILRKTQAAKERLSFEVDYYDTFRIGIEEAKINSRVWQINFLGGGRLRFLIERLENLPPLKVYFEEDENQNLKIGEGWKSGMHLTEREEYDILLAIKNKNLDQQTRFAYLTERHVDTFLEKSQFIDTKDFTYKGVRRIKPNPNIYFFETPRKENQKIFKAPHLLIKENCGLSGIPSALLLENDVTFKHDVIGIHAPEGEEYKLEDLSRYFDQKFILPLMWMFSGRMISVREGVPLMSDILSLPFPKKPLEFSPLEQILLDELIEFQIPFRTQGEKSKALQPVPKSSDLLNQFSDWFTKILNSTYEDFIAHKPLIGKEFIAIAFSLGEPEISLPAKIEALDEWVRETASKQISFNFKVNRIVQLYIRNMIILIKPNQQRYWTRSIAMRDADHVFAYLIAKGV